MPSRSTPPPASVFRKLERFMVGVGMTVMALILERIVMRSIRKQGKPEPRQATTLTSKGGELDLDPD